MHITPDLYVSTRCRYVSLRLRTKLTNKRKELEIALHTAHAPRAAQGTLGCVTHLVLASTNGELMCSALARMSDLA